MSWSMFNQDGQRKYVSKAECSRFLEAAKTFSTAQYLLCYFVASSGARISEALSLTSDSFDFEAGVVVIECLKKRRLGVFRAIPLPPELLDAMKNWLGESATPPQERLWPWTRMTAYRHVRKAMEIAGLSGERAAPKGLRHGFAVGAIQAGVPLNLVQRWLGHADMKTTAIYAAATGPEERSIAARMWSGPAKPAKPEIATYDDEVKFITLLVDKLNISQSDNILHIPQEKLSRNILSAVLLYWLFCNNYPIDASYASSMSKNGHQIFR